MHTQIGIFNNCSYGHFLKKAINLLEKGIGVINIFLQFDLALIPKTKAPIDEFIFMWAPDQKKAVRIFEF